MPPGPVRFDAPPFVPPLWLANNHLQTVYATLFPRAYPAAAPWASAARPRRFALPDGDVLTAVEHPSPAPDAHERPMIVLLHGLEGSAEADYVRGMSHKAFEAGFGSLRLDYRCCGPEELSAERLYNGHLIDDVRPVLEALAAEGHTRIMPVGVSLGANLLLRLLGEWGADAPSWLLGAVAISPPIDMAMGSRGLQTGLGRLYDRYFLTQLQAKLERRAQQRPDDAHRRALADAAHRVTTLREFDEAITAPEGRFDSALDYYQRASSAPTLGAIAVPTLVIAAQDDPFIPYEMYRRRAALFAEHPHLHGVFPRHGGHVGFVAQNAGPSPAPWMDAYWAENQAIAFAIACDEASRR